MARPMIRIHDLSTNEVIDREMTAQEYEDFINPKVEVPTYHAEIAARQADEA